MLRGVILYPFLEIGAKMKSFLRWSNLYTGSPSKLRFALLCCVLLITQEKRVVTTWTHSFKNNIYNLTNIVFLPIYKVQGSTFLKKLLSKIHRYSNSENDVTPSWYKKNIAFFPMYTVFLFPESKTDWSCYCKVSAVARFTTCSGIFFLSFLLTAIY